MTAKSCFALLLLVGGIIGAPVEAATQAGQTLGTVRLPRDVMDNGQALAAGTSAARLLSESVSKVVGQPDDSSRWVEFVQAGQVKGRELATVVAPGDVKQVAKGTPPAQGTARVTPLQGGEYLRVWLNRAGTQ